MNQLIEYQSRAVDAYQRINGCGESEAAKSAAFLVSGYGSLSVHDARGFTEHLIAVMADYPADLCAEAARKIPQTERYLNIAGVKEWLEERMHDRRAEYARAVAEQRAYQQRIAEQDHRETVKREQAEFKKWLEDHPGGTYRQWCGITPYAPPFAMAEDDVIDPVLMGPYPSAGHLVGKLVKEMEP
jgi:hypothetical protein